MPSGEWEVAVMEIAAAAAKVAVEMAEAGRAVAGGCSLAEVADSEGTAAASAVVVAVIVAAKVTLR